MKKIGYIILALVLLYACKTPQVKVKEVKSQIFVAAVDSMVVDTAMVNKILPYKIKLDAEINQVVGITDLILIREKPEGTLGNLAADAVLAYARKNSQEFVDFAVLNYGGIRIASIGKGVITTGKLFEMMPFDNEIVLVKVTGKEVQELFKVIAENEGWPVSGVTCQLQQKEATEIKINGTPLNDTIVYTIATSDYLANGGDQVTCFKAPMSRRDLQVKVRSAIELYTREHSPLHLTIEGRITRKPEN